MNSRVTDTHRAVLAALADTVVPSLDRSDDPTRFWSLGGSDLHADVAVGFTLAELPEQQRAGMLALLDGLHAQDSSPPRNRRASGSSVTLRSWVRSRRRR